MAIDMPNGYKEDYAWVSNDRTSGSEWANAHLIAAAPDMYAALIKILEDVECPDHITDYLLPIVAKAEGK
jgi:hypothetical protein